MNNLKLTELEIRDLLNRYRSEMRKLEFQIQKTQSTLEELSQVIDETPPTAPIRSTQTSSEPKKRGPGRPPKKKRGPGRPPKSESEKRGPGRPPKKKRGPGRPPKKKRGPGRPPKSESKKRGPGRPPKKKRGPGRPPKKKRGPGRPPKSGKRTRKKSGSYKLSNWDQFIIDTIDKADKPLINSELFDKAKEWSEAKNLSDDDIKQYISRTIHKLANKHNTLKKTPYEGRGYAYATEKMVFNNGKLKKEYSR